MDIPAAASHPHDSAPQVRRLLIARGLRALGDGCISIVLPLHLTALGFAPFEVGVIATATLLGSGLLTLLIGLHAYRFRSRTLLICAAFAMAATGLAFGGLTQFWPLLAVAVVGTLNPSSGDVSIFMPLEQATLGTLVDDRRRTATFARYSLVGALSGAVGALLAGVPDALAQWSITSSRTGMQWMFGFYALLGIACSLVYRDLPRETVGSARKPSAPLTRSRRRVLGLAALFSVDAFAGGFLVQSLLALWLFRAFELPPASAAVLFFWTGVFSALSYLVAARLADRIGLLNTMVFTHLPSSIFLLVIPFLSDLRWVIALLIARSALSQMDVPTRTSYVMAIVDPAERPAAASVTSVPRSLAATASPALAGYWLGISSFAWPLFVAGALKIAYDLMLLWTFRTIRPPEEADKGKRRNGKHPLRAL